MIEIQDLHKSFGRNQVLSKLDVSIASGESIAVLGPNGSGKTTLIKCILGMVKPDAGTIKVDGQDVKNNWKYRSTVGYLPQIARFPQNLTVKELIRMIKDIRNETVDEMELIEKFGLTPFLTKKLGNLSGGTKQKVNLVLAFMYDSPIIILDEPTVGLDPIALITLKDLIEREKQKGKTVLITSHIMSFVEKVAEGIVFILDGKIYFKGTIEEIKQKTGQIDLEHAIAAILKKDYV